jgi:uncharacterized protein HemY
LRLHVGHVIVRLLLMMLQLFLLLLLLLLVVVVLLLLLLLLLLLRSRHSTQRLRDWSPLSEKRGPLRQQPSESASQCNAHCAPNEAIRRKGRRSGC